MTDVEKYKHGIEDALKSGPGLDGYVYNADVYCVDCGREIIRDVFKDGRRVDWTTFGDSEQVPQPIFFGESDCAQHCGHCGEYLYGPQFGFHIGGAQHRIPEPKDKE